MTSALRDLFRGRPRVGSSGSAISSKGNGMSVSSIDNVGPGYGNSRREEAAKAATDAGREGQVTLAVLSALQKQTGLR